ncbi:hypothetical protein DFH27DRAFT_360454 [Peziza echinospora]|nr:hypothetical protein DFH27DRAFT_360454 [Peziza echinospora]
MTWTTRQLQILETTTRVGSVFSLMGAGFIILTFCVSPEFHKPINRLAFFAAFGNILTNVATLISQDGIKAYHENPSSGVCKMQAMLIQWFMPADALFCCAMALNVYLTVFKKYSSHRLQRLEIPYVVACYGIPFIPALTYLFISKTKKDGHEASLYGPATLWCWVSDDWQILRIASFYGPVWVVLLATFAIYILAGKVIFKLRGTLRGFAREMSASMSGTGHGYSGGTGTITSVPPAIVNTGTAAAGGGVPGGVPGHKHAMSADDAMLLVGTHNSMINPDVQLPFGTAAVNRSGLEGGQMAMPMLSDAGPVAGVNMHHNQPHTAYSCVVETGRMVPNTNAAILAARHKSAVEANTAAWAYCRCAMLFFLALVITWLPSSINRVYTVVHPGATNFGLHFASALVLPCQGFWNGLIYIITTLPACRVFFYDLQDRWYEIWARITIAAGKPSQPHVNHHHPRLHRRAGSNRSIPGTAAGGHSVEPMPPIHMRSHSAKIVSGSGESTSSVGDHDSMDKSRFMGVHHHGIGDGGDGGRLGRMMSQGGGRGNRASNQSEHQLSYCSTDDISTVRTNSITPQTSHGARSPHQYLQR